MRIASIGSLAIAIALAAAGSLACSSSDKCGGATGCADVVEPDTIGATDTFVPPEDIPTGQPDYGEVAVSPEVQAYMASYQAALAESTDMTTDELFAAHYVERPYLDKVGVDALKADNMDLIVQKYELTQAEQDRIAADGFVVVDRVRYDNHPFGYLDIFNKDLPVLVTTDSILFAIHKSYDQMLKDLEETVLIGALDAMLAAAHGTLALAPTGNDAYNTGVCDTDLIYTVARSLLSATKIAPVCANNAAVRDDLLAKVDALQPEAIELFGRAYPCPLCRYDFSQFKPRGHYTETEELKQYFRSMIWLGRTEIALTRFQRELVASVMLLDSLEAAQKLDAWKAFDKAIQVFVGKSDNLTMEGLAKFLADQKADVAAATEPANAKALMKALEAGGYGEQKIMSQIMMTNPLSDSPTALPPIFAFLGQRFTIDSYVFNNVTYDRIVYQDQKMERYMPSPLDVAFVLGYQEALPLLKTELDTWHYAQPLHMLRYLVDSYDASFWTESMYNTWLAAIRELAADTTGAGMPDAAKTLAYAKKSMNAGLASWAELRHDTILYVKQSYTGEACDYPDAYVEPFPGFFRKVAQFATVSKDLFGTIPLDMDPYYRGNVTAYFDNLAKVAGNLAAIAEVEIKGEPRTPDQTEFLRELVKTNSMCGEPPFSGWYAGLFYGVSDSTFQFKPTIADVHTDPNSTNVLHVGTGHPNLMVFVANTSCGSKAYAGPASSYFEHLEPGFARLTDEDWAGKVGLAPRPEWTSAFVK